MLIFKKEKSNKIFESRIISIVGKDENVKVEYIKELAQYLKRKNKKITIINLNYFDNLEKIKIKNVIINPLNKILLKNNKKIEEIEFDNYLERLKKEFNYIIINNSIETFFELNKISFKKSSKINVLINNNLNDFIYYYNLFKIYKNNLEINLNYFYLIIYKIKNKKIKIKNIIPYFNNLINNKIKINIFDRRYFGINK